MLAEEKEELTEEEIEQEQQKIKRKKHQNFTFFTIGESSPRFLNQRSKHVLNQK